MTCQSVSKSLKTDLHQPWVFKDPPLNVRSEGVIGLMGESGAVLTKLVVALWDVHVPVPVQPDSIVRSGQEIYQLLLCFNGWLTWAGAPRHKCLTSL